MRPLVMRLTEIVRAVQLVHAVRPDHGLPVQLGLDPLPLTLNNMFQVMLGPNLVPDFGPPLQVSIDLRLQRHTELVRLLSPGQRRQAAHPKIPTTQMVPRGQVVVLTQSAMSVSENCSDSKTEKESHDVRGRGSEGLIPHQHLIAHLAEVEADRVQVSLSVLAVG